MIIRTASFCVGDDQQLFLLNQSQFSHQARKPAPVAQLAVQPEVLGNDDQCAQQSSFFTCNQPIVIEPLPSIIEEVGDKPLESAHDSNLPMAITEASILLSSSSTTNPVACSLLPVQTFSNNLHDKYFLSNGIKSKASKITEIIHSSNTMPSIVCKQQFSATSLLRSLVMKNTKSSVAANLPSMQPSANVATSLRKQVTGESPQNCVSRALSIHSGK